MLAGAFAQLNLGSSNVVFSLSHFIIAESMQTVLFWDWASFHKLAQVKPQFKGAFSNGIEQYLNKGEV